MKRDQTHIFYYETFKQASDRGVEHTPRNGSMPPEEGSYRVMKCRKNDQAKIDKALAEGLVEIKPSEWQAVLDNHRDHPYFQSPEIDDQSLLSVQLKRLEAGKIAKARIGIEIAKLWDSKALTLDQFNTLNDQSAPVTLALDNGQFQTALLKFQSLFGLQALLSAEFKSAVQAIIRTEIQAHDGLTDLQIDALIGGA